MNINCMIVIDNKEYRIELPINSTLDICRDQISKTIKFEKFLFKNSPDVIIDRSDENSIEIQDIYEKISINNNQIYKIYLHKEFALDLKKIDLSPSILQISTNNPVKKIIFIGPSKSGKSTLINSFINYIKEAKFTDKTRYLVDSFLKCYDINHKNENIFKLIDSPGFGDDSKMAVDKINQLIDENKQIDAYCIVLQSSFVRFGSDLKNIFETINKLKIDFNRCCFMITYSDAGESQVTKEIKKYFKINDEHIFYFNNSCLFYENNNNEINTPENKIQSLLWANNEINFYRFINLLSSLKSDDDEKEIKCCGCTIF